MPGAAASGEPPCHRVGTRRAEMDDGVRRMQRPGLDEDQGGIALDRPATTATEIHRLGGRFHVIHETSLAWLGSLLRASPRKSIPGTTA
jgi:hypothetical protein